MIQIMRKLLVLTVMVTFASCPSEPEPIPPPDSGVGTDSSSNVRRLMNYLMDQYGNYIISGQMDTAWATNARMDMTARVFFDTGKYPALKGFDMMELPYSWSNNGKDQIDEAVEWWEGKNKMYGVEPAKQLLPDRPDIHGIVAFCWHWRTPSEFYTDRTSFRIPWKDGKLDSESGAFKNTIIADLDKAAILLKILKDKDIPVLWRPLHEASGGWFWWGAKDVSNPAARYKALWEFMYDYFTNKKGLDNLIWVWNGQHKDWFPDPNTVDIVGYDVYAKQKDYSSQSEKFRETLEMAPKKNRIVALTENGEIPDPAKCKQNNAMWSWFMTWNDAKEAEGETDSGNFWTGEYHNTNAHKSYVYNHDLVITLDKLPDLSSYRLD